MLSLSSMLIPSFSSQDPPVFVAFSSAISLQDHGGFPHRRDHLECVFMHLALCGIQLIMMGDFMSNVSEQCADICHSEHSHQAPANIPTASKMSASANNNGAGGNGNNNQGTPTAKEKTKFQTFEGQARLLAALVASLEDKGVKLDYLRKFNTPPYFQRRTFAPGKSPSRRTFAMENLPLHRTFAMGNLPLRRTFALRMSPRHRTLVLGKFTRRRTLVPPLDTEFSPSFPPDPAPSSSLAPHLRRSLC